MRARIAAKWEPLLIRGVAALTLGVYLIGNGTAALTMALYAPQRAAFKEVLVEGLLSQAARAPVLLTPAAWPAVLAPWGMLADSAMLLTAASLRDRQGPPLAATARRRAGVPRHPRVGAWRDARVARRSDLTAFVWAVSIYAAFTASVQIAPGIRAREWATVACV